MSNNKSKLLKKYLGQAKQQKQTFHADGLNIKDNQIDFNQSLSSDQDDDEAENKNRKRIYSDDEQQQQVIKKNDKKQKQQIKSKRISKSIRKALGLKKGQDADELINSIKIQGIDMKQLEDYLKKNKQGLHLQNKKQKKIKKIKQKQRQQYIKEQQKSQSSQSDLVIPEQSRTIYRNKDGTIRQHSQSTMKKMHQEAVKNRLGQWQKGMKKDESSEQQHVDIWDDPAKRWSSQLKKPLKCPYHGYANRFDIKPGFRWDGVIRGNGFEAKYLQQINIRKMKEQQQNKDYLKNL